MSTRKFAGGTSPKAVAVIKLRYLGDVLLTTPVARTLKRAWPGTRIYFLVWKGSDAVLEGNKEIDRILTIRQDGSLSVIETLTAIKTLRNESVDIAIDLTGNDRSALMTRLSGATTRIGFSSGKRRRDAMAYTHVIPVGDPDLHQIDRNLLALRPLGIDPADRIPKMIVLPEVDASVRALLKTSGVGPGPLVLFHPGARRWYKSWPPERFADLADRLSKAGIQPILAGGPEDEEVCRTIAERMKSTVVNLAGKTTILELAALCRLASVFIGNDSAPLHIAAAVRTPTVSFFGLTNWKNWAPRGDAHVALWRECACAPYGHKRECERGEKRCLVQISVDEAFDAVMKLLHSGPCGC